MSNPLVDSTKHSSDSTLYLYAELVSHTLHKWLLHDCRTCNRACNDAQLQQNGTQVEGGGREGRVGEANLGSSVSEMDTSLVATTSTLMPLLLKISKTVAMKPTCPSILVLTMSSRVMPGLSTMLVIKASFMSRSSDMRVPAAALHGDSSACQAQTTHKHKVWQGLATGTCQHSHTWTPLRPISHT